MKKYYRYLPSNPIAECETPNNVVKVEDYYDAEYQTNIQYSL